MASTFTWLDCSERERRKAMDVIDLFHEKGTLDELGIGTVRDALADLLFPGISTIQTRVRYFLFVPWIYLDLERRRVSGADAAAHARREEVRLLDALAAAQDARGGVFGIQSRGDRLRLPSEIYWGGLRSWGIRLFPGPVAQYHRSLGRFYLTLGRARQRRAEVEADASPALRNWHPAISGAPEDFPTAASLRLTQAEADYLRKRIVARHSGTLLAFLVEEGAACKPTRFIWDHPQLGEMSGTIREVLAQGAVALSSHARGGPALQPAHGARKELAGEGGLL